MFAPNPTRFDLRFRLFRTPVRVHPGFWLMTLLLGIQTFEEGVVFFLLWVGCVFVSILVHEFGHVIAAGLCGRRGQVMLHSFGGVTITESDPPQRWRRIAISLAGPAAGFLMYGLVVFVKDEFVSQIPQQFLIQNPTFTQIIVKGTTMLLRINLIWSLLNLVPIMPLDGGEVSQEILSAFSPRNGLRIALYLSIILSLGAAAYCIYAWTQKIRLPFNLHGLLTALLLAMLAIDCVQMLLADNKLRRETEAENQDMVDR